MNTFQNRVALYSQDDLSTKPKYWFKYMDTCPDGKFITIIANYDGVSLTESNKKSLWPLQLAILELPYNVRFRYIMLASLWYCDLKPPITSLQSFVSELIMLSHDPIFIENIGNIPVFLSAISADAVARPILQGIQQFNGKYGCTWCIQEMRSIHYSHIYEH